MNRCLLLAVAILLFNSLGCQSTQDKDTSNKKTISYASPFSVQADFDQLPEVISSLFENLGISLVEKDEKPGSCVYIGKSLSGHTVRIETTALVKGESVIFTVVEGEKGVGDLLRNKITQVD